MKPLISACLCALLLAGCSAHRGPLATPPSNQSPSHPRYAPPPGGHSHWDASLGVYVLENADHLYYRERTYYRWNQGWSWSSGPQGPWQPSDDSRVPAALGKHYRGR